LYNTINYEKFIKIYINYSIWWYINLFYTHHADFRSFVDSIRSFNDQEYIEFIRQYEEYLSTQHPSERQRYNSYILLLGEADYNRYYEQMEVYLEESRRQQMLRISSDTEVLSQQIRSQLSQENLEAENEAIDILHQFIANQRNNQIIELLDEPGILDTEQPLGNSVQDLLDNYINSSTPNNEGNNSTLSTSRDVLQPNNNETINSTAPTD